VSRSERGAAAVEFALVVPLLVLLIAGIAEFGRAYYLQTTVSASAREGVRSLALKNPAANVRAAARDAASPLTLTDTQIALVTCPATTGTTTPPPNAKVTVTYTTPFMTGFFGASVTLTGRGVMRCGG